MTLRSDTLAALNMIPGLEGRWFADFAPDKSAPPYGTLLTDISDVPILSGDAKPLAYERLLQADLWEARASENGALRDAIWRKLDGLLIPSAMCRLRVMSAPRVPDPDFSIAHRAFTVAAITRAVS